MNMYEINQERVNVILIVHHGQIGVNMIENHVLPQLAQLMKQS